MKRFEGKIAVVTGAGKGIGAAAAERLASEGAVVAVNDIRPEGAEAVVRRIRDNGGNAEVFAADMSKGPEIREMFRKIAETLGDPDILVNNAGGSCRALGHFVPFLEYTDDVLEWEIGVNLKGTIISIQSVLPGMMKKHYGKIVNLSSITGVVGMPGIPVYSATKGAIASLTKALAMDYGIHGININAVAPAAVATRPGMEQLGNATFLKRACSPDEVANLICYLCSDEAGFITGQNHVIDGGRILGPRTGEEALKK